MKTPHLLLKFGTLKGWANLTPEQVEALNKYAALGLSASVMIQKDTPPHKIALCAAIDLFEDYQITNDWTGEKMTVEEAKKYVMEYRE